MLDGLSIVNEFNDQYESNYYAWNAFYPLADADLRAYLGDQWTDQEKTKLFQEGRNQWVYNLIRKNINLIDGYQRSHRLSSVIVPQEGKDQEAADEMSDLVQYVFQAGDGYKAISDAFSGAIKTGWNLCTVWLDYRDDPVNGDIKFGREPYSGFITDPYFTQLDFSDCSNVMRRKYLSPELAASLLPDMAEEVYDLYASGWSRDDKFTWLPYQQQPNGQDFIAYNEYYKQMWKQVPVVVDTETGNAWEIGDGTEKLGELKRWMRERPSLVMIKRSKRFVECHTILNNTYFKTSVNQFGLDEYPFTPFVGVFQPESEFWGLKLQSLSRCVLDPQRQLNRRLCQMDDIIESQINSGWIADEDSVVNPNSLFQTSQGRVIWKKQGASPTAITRLEAAQIPPSFFQLTDVFAKGITEIMGVNDAAFGVPESGNESGIMMMLRQGAAISNQQNVFDNLRYAQKQLTKKVVKLIQTWTPQKVERILGKKPTEQFFEKNFPKYDISIQEGMLTDTQKQMHFRQLVDLKQLGAPVSGTMLAKAAPLQGKTEYLKELEQAEQQQAQQAQQQAQVQMQLVEGQMEANKAMAIERLAGAKERFTRAFANVGLSDERSARAIDDRASAALDRAKAMKELASLDDERLFKYLSIVRMMEQTNKQGEEEIKRDDLAIASQGQELGDIQANKLAGGNTPPQEQLLAMMQGQQPQEAPNGNGL